MENVDDLINNIDAAQMRLFDNITAMLLTQGLNPRIHRDELYLTFDSTGKDIKSAINEEVDLIFGDDVTYKKVYSLKRCSHGCTLYLVKRGKEE